MKKLLFSLALVSLSLGTARAEETVTKIELKRKSHFDAADARDPFWPIGWKKPGPKVSNTEAGPGLSPESFSLTSVTTGSGTHFAILNGKIMQEGQVFGLQFGHQIYQVTVQSIQDGKVVLTSQDGRIIVPLRRK